MVKLFICILCNASSEITKNNIGRRHHPHKWINFNNKKFFNLLQSAEMMNFFLNTTNMKHESKDDKTIQTKIPQNAVNDKETFNDKTRKSLLKINLFIKRLKFFNIFTTNQQQQQQTNKAQKTSTMAMATEQEKW